MKLTTRGPLCSRAQRAVARRAMIVVVLMTGCAHEPGEPNALSKMGYVMQSTAAGMRGPYAPLYQPPFRMRCYQNGPAVICEELP